MQKARKIIALLLTMTLVIAIAPVLSTVTKAADTGASELYQPVSVDMTYIMAIKDDGNLWGGETRLDDYPKLILEDVASIYFSTFTAFAIKTDSTLWAWGNNEYGHI